VSGPGAATTNVANILVDQQLGDADNIGIGINGDSIRCHDISRAHGFCPFHCYDVILRLYGGLAKNMVPRRHKNITSVNK
jgi:hypothetical protein|tara:strand:- start:6325 stop:6564 length:240 start_codon:yes stop_codon:yes gene_type:complete